MDYKIYAVRIGEKYGIHYEHDLEQKLGHITWIREEEPGVLLQWNKLRAFNENTEQAIVLIDIDLEFIGSYTDLFELPIERGEFLTTRSWWGQDNPTAVPYKISGGFYKFYPKDTRHIYETFRQDKEFWQTHYIKEGITKGPVNGEMNFVEDCIRGRVGNHKPLHMKFVPDSWHTTFRNDKDHEYLSRLTKAYKHDYLWLGDFHPDIKMVHYHQQQGLAETSLSKWTQDQRNPQPSLVQTSSL
jgi:hypothetical protein